MKISGFTFIRNALIYDYPILEAIQSILPICDEVIVAVGKSDDKTLELIQSIPSSKIKIIETIWDDSLRQGGKVLALETDKAFQAISKDADWSFYIQGDEVVHEQYLETVVAAMKKYKSDKKVDGLLFNYVHFYGSYSYVGVASSWYAKEIRVIKNNPSIYSYKDAQGFRKEDNKKLNVKEIDAAIYHYGWVKPPSTMLQKKKNFSKYWHSDTWIKENIEVPEEFDYAEGMRSLNKFEGTHPKVMQARIDRKNWEFEFDISLNDLAFKDKLKRFARQYLGLDFGYKNYRKV